MPQFRVKEKNWELGRRILVGGAAAVLAGGIFLGTGTAQTSDETAAPSPAAQVTPSVEAAPEAKEEVVYATLSAAGDVDAVYVVNHFTTIPGTELTDYGDYTEVVNLSDTTPVILEDGVVTFTSAEDNFYYQGNLERADLPWEFQIDYLLDGKRTAPADLAGKSGELEIRLKSEKDAAVNAAFYDNYMLQIQITLASSVAKKVDAPGAVAASAGANQLFTYTVLPGNDADITLSAVVSDFEMPGISITGMPYSMDIEMPDIGDSLSDLEKLPEAIAQLNDGIGELESGTRDMRSGTEELQSGSASIRSGLSLLADSGTSLRSGSSRISRALGQISSALADSGLDDLDLSDMEALPESLGLLQSGLKELSGNLSQLSDGFGQAYQALEGAVEGIPGPEISQEDIEGVMAQLTDPGDLYVVGTLAANYEAAQTVRGTFAGTRTAFDSVEPALSQITGGLDQMADQLADALGGMQGQLSSLDGLSQLHQLQSGLEDLADNYGEFNDGLAGYTAGVSELASNYSRFHAGISQLTSGAGQLNSGVRELHEGTSTLNEEISDLPVLIQSEIDKMKAEYLPPDFSPVSFTSTKNDGTSLVQFVLQCSGIQKPETDTENAEADEPEETTFWDRLESLFD